MLEVSALACTRGDRTLFRGVSFKLAAGGLLHVAGANGSGKTSLLRLLCGLGTPEAGEVRWRGERIRALRETYAQEMVYMGHDYALKEDLSAIENLQVACMLAGNPATNDEARQALAAFGLAACEHLPVRALSQGQKRRSALARLELSIRVPLWILDEPFSALDVDAVRYLEQLILTYMDGGGSVIFTTHQDAAIASRVTLRVVLNDVAETVC